MLKRLLLVLIFLVCVAADKEDKPSMKAALQEFNEFIGEWKGSGAPEKLRPDLQELWSETISWSWRFKGDDAWLTLAVKNGKHLKGGELHYLPDKQRYRFTALDPDNKP